MTSLRGYALVAWAGLALVALVLVVDRFGEGWKSAATAGRVLAIVGAVIVAGVCYQVFSAHPPRSPRVIAAVVAGLVGGASTASAAASAPSGQATSDGAIAIVGLVVLAFACVVLQLEAHARSEGDGSHETPGSRPR